MATEASELIAKLAALSQQQEDLKSNMNVRTEALELCRKITLELEDPADTAMNVRFYPAFAMAARIAIDLRIFALLSESTSPVDANELAKQTGANANLISRILRPLASLGLIRETAENTWTASPATHAMCRPATEAGHIHTWAQCTTVQIKMPEYLRKTNFQQPEDQTDGPLQYAFGTKKTAFEYWHDDEAVFENFNTFMTGSRIARPSWVDWWPVQERILDDLPEITASEQDSYLLVDIAGGRGHDVQAFAKKFGKKHGLLAVEDLPKVIDNIKDLDADIKRVKHDFFDPQPIIGARIYFFHFILHDWSDSKCLEILKQTMRAMRRGYSKLILNEWIIPDTDCPASLAGYDLAMMTMLGAQERTMSQWTNLLQQAGLRIIESPTSGVGIEGIIEAELA